MYFIKVHDTVDQAIRFFYRLGLWHRGDEATVTGTIIQLFYSAFYFLFPISLIWGAIMSDNKDDSIFLIMTGIMTTAVSVKLIYLIWKKEDILKLLHQIGDYSTEDHEEFTLINDKLNFFFNLIKMFIFSTILAAVFTVLGVPVFSSGRKLFYSIAFPLDWKNNEIAYWTTVLFLWIEALLGAIAVLFSMIMWYLMISCDFKCKILGNHIRNMGVIKTENLEVEKQNLYFRDLIAGLETYQDITESTCQLESFYSDVLSALIATSGISICGSVYCLAFNSGNFMNYIFYLFFLFYNIFDIFMVMYFGNEITLSSDRLSYCLFESNWMDQSESCKKCVIIFGERLKQPLQVIILKLYPLTLETFTRILNSAYSMFNILKSLK